MKKLTLIIAVLLLSALQTSAAVNLIFGDGAAKNRLRMIFVSEGYTSSQIANFANDVKTIYNQFATQKFYSIFGGAINVYGVDTISQQSGADPSPSSNTVNTAFDASFGNSGIDRLLCVNDTKVRNFLIGKIKNYDPNYDITVVVVNSTTYGGSGGQIACTSVNSSAPQVAIHETGHSFANLADEYSDAYPGWTQTEMPNSTHYTTRAQIPWAIWISAATPIPTPDNATYNDSVGLFEGCQYMTTGWYRPWRTCQMRALGNPFCKVCCEFHAVSSWGQIGPIDSVWPAVTDTVRVTGPCSLSVKRLPLSILPAVTWYVNGTPASVTSAVLNLATVPLKTGANTVMAIVLDQSGLMREASHLRLGIDTATWIVKSTSTFAAAPDFAQLSGIELRYSGSRCISVTVPVPGSYDLHVYSLSGKCEAVLNNMEIRAGMSLLKLPHDLPAGCHLADLRPHMSTAIRKLLIVR
jgi:hypothetical protein